MTGHVIDAAILATFAVAIVLDNPLERNSV
jgi:hypothetical protein